MNASPPPAATISRNRPLGIVHAIIDLSVATDPAETRRRVRSLLEAGLPSLQLRGRGRTKSRLRSIAAMLRQETSRTGARLVVNTEVELAVAIDADGVHLGADGPDPADVRAGLPRGMLVGASCHDWAEIERATAADWILLSPVFPTRSKPGSLGLGLERFGTLAREAIPPVYALGGVRADNLEACLEAGAAGVAAIRAHWDDPANALVERALHAAGRGFASGSD